mmetsp:Transcript_11231/g.22976  ORF Transcript_11231/g.22976 Transcript_11231/m.22976 type:complete len:937 (+) Transcript_11231:45-2855(+)
MVFESDLNVSNFYSSSRDTRLTMNNKETVGKGKIRRQAIAATAARNKLKNTANMAAFFKKRRAPLRLNPMQSIVSTNQQAPDIEGISANSDLEKQMYAIAKAKKAMKIKRSSVVATRSSVQTPAVLNFMKGLSGVDEGGLGVYKSEVQELSDLTDSASTIRKGGIAENSIIDSWVKSFDIEKNSYDSVALFAEVRLKEALAATDEIKLFSGFKTKGEFTRWEVIDGVRTKVHADKQSEEGKPKFPSALRIAMCSDLMRKISGMFGRYESVMKTLTEEMMRCIYSDYDSVISGAGYIDARTFYHCTPYFEQLKNCEIRRDELIEELDVYNDGVDLRKAIAKCSVGVRTMFNDARRAIRDIIFRVWKDYVMLRKRKMKKLRLRVQLEPYFNKWKLRHQRFQEHGYFYDSGSDVDSDDEELRKEEEEYDAFDSKNMRAQFAGELDGSSYKKLLERMQNNLSPGSVSSNSSDESPPSEIKKSLPMTRLRGASMDVLRANRARASMRLSGHHKLLKLIKEIEEDGRIVRMCERRRHHVNLVDMACQTDFDPMVVEKVAPVATSTATAKKDKKQADLSSMLGSKKEKAMSLDNGLQLIPSLYEQYLTMLANPGPDTVGKHLNFVKFTQDALIRKFGIKKIAMKQYRALAALIQSKKGLEHPRVRVFASLYGLSTHAGEEGPGYKAEYIDFFFQRILPKVFANAKQVNAILGAKGHSDIDLDKFLKRMEDIFPNFLKKDGFKYMVLEDKIEKKMSRKTKGIEMVDADVVIECLIAHWEQELLLDKDTITWDTMRTLKNFQQRVKAIMRGRKKEHEAEHGLEKKWNDKFGSGFPQEFATFQGWLMSENMEFQESVGEEQLQQLYDKIVSYKAKKEKIDKRSHNNEGDVKSTSQTIPEYFAVTVWRMKLLKQTGEGVGALVQDGPTSHRRTHAASLVKRQPNPIL